MPVLLWFFLFPVSLPSVVLSSCGVASVMVERSAVISSPREVVSPPSSVVVTAVVPPVLRLRILDDVKNDVQVAVETNGEKGYFLKKQEENNFRSVIVSGGF